MKDTILTELTYFLKNAIEYLIVKEIGSFTHFFDDFDVNYLNGLNIKTNYDLIMMSESQSEEILSNDKLKKSVVSYLAEVNEEYFYSSNYNNVTKAPCEFISIIEQSEPWFAKRKINLDLYPCNRLKITLDRVNVKTYGELKNFFLHGLLCKIPGLGLYTRSKLVTIVLVDYHYLKEICECDVLDTYQSKSPIDKFSEILEESYEYFKKVDLIEYKNKWDYTFECLKNDLYFGLAHLYGENARDIILDPNFSNDDVYLDSIMEETGFSLEKIIEIRTVVRNEFLETYSNEEIVADEHSIQHNFYFRCYRLGKYEMAGFVGILNRYFPFYPEVLKVIGNRYPKIKYILDKIDDFVREQEKNACGLNFNS